jgi:prepilin-type N-terminal cleavage/methylation domain-containing protein
MRPHNTYKSKLAFTLVELIVVIAIIAIIAGIAIPKVLAARLTANEAAAISSLRALITAQTMIQTQAHIDSDGDGVGEDGYFGELAGTATLRTSAGGVPAPGVHRLTPAVLSVAFGKVNANGLVSRAGYYFQLWLPGTPVGGLTPGIAELPTAGGADPANMPDSEACAYLWCCYAWPTKAGSSGNRAFFVNQRGDLLQCNNTAVPPFSGTTNTPPFDEAFLVPGDMGSKSRVGVAGGSHGTTWVTVQ